MKIAPQTLVALAALLTSLAFRGDAHGGFVLLDDFESYEVTSLQEMVSSEGWIPHGLTEMHRIDQEPGNKFLAIGYYSSTRTASRYLPPDMVVKDRQMATLFLRFRVMSDSVADARFGLANNPRIRRDSNPQAFGPMLGISGEGSHFDLRVLDGSGNWRKLATVTHGTWYNCWLIIDRAAANGFAVYLTEGQAAAEGRHRLSYRAEPDKVTGIFAFPASHAPFNFFMASGWASPSDSVQFDDLWLNTRGLNLANPASGTASSALAAGSSSLEASGDWHSIDTSGDGLADGEALALGLNPMHDHSDLLASLSRNPEHAAGIATSQNMADLALGQPVLRRNPSTGLFHFYMQFQRSENLRGWSSLDLLAENVRTTPDGVLEIIFPASDANTEFYRLRSVADVP